MRGGASGMPTTTTGGTAGTSTMAGAAGSEEPGLYDAGIEVPTSGVVTMPAEPSADAGLPTGEWELGASELTTQWTQDVSPEALRPEYPRPMLVRTAWASLDGLWDYSIENFDTAVPPRTGNILVPYAVESALSGVTEPLTYSERLVYRRSFTVPKSWKGWGIKLNFGAVDYEAKVTINDKPLEVHAGGYDAFSFDITPHLVDDGPQQLVVTVTDPTDTGSQPRGKQSAAGADAGLHSAVSGIWQTVWIEPVPLDASVSRLKVTPDLDQKTVTVEPTLQGVVDGTRLRVQVFNGEDLVVETTVDSPAAATLTLPEPLEPWSPESPFLYDLRVDLLGSDGETQLDTVGSYFAMRKISLESVSLPRVLLNDELYYQMGVLDQGYWPDGLYTAPTDDALRSDIEIAKSLGFNMLRKHMKVEPARWYYWCDKLGMLVWQDMVASQNSTDEASHQAFVQDATRTINDHYNNPSIVTWVVFTGGWGELNTLETVSTLAALDPTRLFDGTSGQNIKDTGNFVDQHSYPVPLAFSPTKTRATVIGGFGGIGLYEPEHAVAAEPVSNVQAQTSTELVGLYRGFVQKLFQLRTDYRLSASVYSQLIDVEREQNGLLTYDRASLKASAPAIAAINAGETPTVYSPTSELAAQTWKYRTSTPLAAWYETAFDDSAWSSAPGAFGANIANLKTGTTWNTPDIWMRRTFEVTDLPTKLLARYFHDESVEVWLNGKAIFQANGFDTYYNEAVLPQAAINALKVGTNVLAVHCRQTAGGQYIDFGLYDGG